MKKLILSLSICCMMTAFSYAQDKSATIQQETERLTALYSLSSDQVKEMNRIQTTKLNNLEEIEALKTSDSDLYDRKLTAIGYHTQMSIRKILNPDQLRTFKENHNEMRREKATIISEGRKSGASEDEIRESLKALELGN